MDEREEQGDQPMLRKQYLDNLLADFTDKLLGDKGGVGLGNLETGLIVGTRERLLEEMVVALKKALVEDSPRAEVSAHIRERLAAEWKAEMEKARAESPPDFRKASIMTWLERLERRFNLRSLTAPRSFALSFAVVVIVVLVAVVLINPQIGSGLPGAVFGPGGWLPLTIVLLVLGGIAVFLFLRSRR
jgi:hypothetical protein